MVCAMSDRPDEHKPEAIVKWWGQSKDVVSGFPDQVKQNLGTHCGCFSGAKSLMTIGRCHRLAKGCLNCGIRIKMDGIE